MTKHTPWRELCARLRGQYEVGPNAEFGTRQFPVAPIQNEAADMIEHMADLLTEIVRQLDEIETVGLETYREAEAIAKAKGTDQ